MSRRHTAAFDPLALGRVGGVSRETRGALEAYETLLLKWQKAVNLVGSATLDDVWNRHFIDSAQLAPLIPRRGDGKAPVVLDAGSGAGFPGLVLAILSATGAVPEPGFDVHLVESNARKCAFLREAARVTNSAVTVHHRRVEALAPFPVDVVTARGFAPLPRLLDLLRGFLETPAGPPMGLFLKGRRAQRELTEARKHWKMRVQTIASVTDPDGVVLRIEDIVRG